MLTVTQAAQETGLSRVAIYKAIKQGRLSVTKGDNGQTLIDAAELFRVYSPVNKQSDNQVNKSLHNSDNQLLTKELEFTKQLLRQVEHERDGLKNSVEYLQQNLNQAMAMLTHQPEPPPAPSKAKPEDSMLWRKLFGRRSGY
jgi:aminopeptidase C